MVAREGRNVLKRPTGASFRDGDAWAVFAFADERGALTHVSPGHITALETEMPDGFGEHAYAVMHPSNQERNGTRIMLGAIE